MKNTLCRIIGSMAAIVAIFAACCVDSPDPVGIAAEAITAVATVVGYTAYMLYDFEDTGRWDY